MAPRQERLASVDFFQCLSNHIRRKSFIHSTVDKPIAHLFNCDPIHIIFSWCLIVEYQNILHNIFFQFDVTHDRQNWIYQQ